MNVRCRVCLREEVWEGDSHTVLVEGGRRRPAVHPELAAWRTALSSRRGEIGIIVGQCPGCKQPLISDAGTPQPWRVKLPDGEILVASEIMGPTGVLTEEQATERIERAYLERVSPGRVLIESAFMGSMIAPILVWLLAVSTVFWMIWNFATGALNR